MKFALSLAAVLFIAQAGTSAFAATDTVTIYVTGTLTKPACTLTSSKSLNANFGSLPYDQIASAPLIDIPVTLSCPSNSSLNISIKAASAVSGSTTQASAGKNNLAYSLLWNSDNTAANITGVKRSLTNLSGAVNLSLKAKLIALGALTEGAFNTSAVISIEYL